MKVEEQVCSLKLAERLKGLGVEQRSSWYWVGRELWWVENVPLDHFYCSAFTSEELGEKLPVQLQLKNRKGTFELHQFKMDTKWGIAYKNRSADDYRWEFEADTEADARAKILIYLLENKIILPSSC